MVEKARRARRLKRLRPTSKPSAKTIEPLAFAQIEHGPALILRAQPLVRSEPLAPALADLERAVARFCAAPRVR